jgi:hypothetical protein
MEAGRGVEADPFDGNGPGKGTAMSGAWTMWQKGNI